MYALVMLARRGSFVHGRGARNAIQLSRMRAVEPRSERYPPYVPENPDSRRRIAALGVSALALGLIALGLGALIAPSGSAEMYGVPVLEPTWVRAAGVRDLILGLVLLVLRSEPSARRRLLPLILLVPLADIGLVLSAGYGVGDTLPHVGGVVGVTALIGLGRET